MLNDNIKPLIECLEHSAETNQFETVGKLFLPTAGFGEKQIANTFIRKPFWQLSTTFYTENY